MNFSIFLREFVKHKSNTIMILTSHNEEIFDITDKFIDFSKTKTEINKNIKE
jgi:molybdopterin synthase catalytic subunit